MKRPLKTLAQSARSPNLLHPIEKFEGFFRRVVVSIRQYKQPHSIEMENNDEIYLSNNG